MASNKDDLGKVGDADFKANWSGFLSQDYSKPINVSRNEIFKNASQSKERSWRDFMGDVMVYIFENASAEEMLELLTKNNYMDQRAYTEAAKALGIDRETAKAQYRELTLKVGK